MWYFVWFIAVLLSLGVGLIAVMWVDVRSKPVEQTAVSRETDAVELTSWVVAWSTTPEKTLKTGIAELAKIHTGDFRITPNQNMIIAGVDKENIVLDEENIVLIDMGSMLPILKEWSWNIVMNVAPH